MAAPARRLSNRQLFKALDIDPDMEEFIAVHKGDEANLMALFDNIAALKETSPEDWTRINAVAMNVENPDDIVEAIAREIFPPVKQGVRGKDPSTTAAVEQRVGAATDTQDGTALAEVPPETPAPPAQPAAPAAKKTRGRPKNQPAAETPPVVPPAMPPAGVTPGDTAVIAGGAVPAATGTGDVSAFTDTVSPRGESPLRQYNPFEGIDFSQFQQGMPSQAAPQMQPQMPQPMPSTPDAGMSIDDMIAAMDALDYRSPPPASADPMALLGQLMDGYNASGGMPGEYGPSQFTPSGGAPGTYGPEMPSFDAMSGINSAGGMDGGYGPSPFTASGGMPGAYGPEMPPGVSPPGGGGNVPPTSPLYQPATDATRNFMKARGLEGLNTGVLTKPVDHLIRNSPFYGLAAAGAGGMYAASRPTPPPQEELYDKTLEELQADKARAYEALKTIKGPGYPVGLAPRGNQ